MKTAGRIIGIVACILMVILMAWIILSWVNVVCNNWCPEAASKIWSWNIFKLLVMKI